MADKGQFILESNN